MQATIRRLDVKHEVNFSAPLLDLPARSDEVLQAFHKGVGSRHPFGSADMQVSKGARLSEARVRIDLFNRYGLIEVTADRLSINCSYIQNAQQAAICRECILLGERTLREVFSDLAVRTEVFDLYLSLLLDDETTSAGQHLSWAAQPSFKGDSHTFGSVRTYPLVHLDMDNEQEHWRALFSAREEEQDTPFLSAFCFIAYNKDAAIRGLEERLQHMERLSSTFLNGISLEVANPLFGLEEAEL